MRRTVAAVLVLAGCGAEAPPSNVTLHVAPPLEVGGWFTLELTGGTDVTGELIATYDHSVWWTDPTDELTYALFDITAYAPWPDDRSMRFIPRSEVATHRTAPAATAYRDHLRAQGITIDTPPLDGIFYVHTAHESYHLEENGGGDFAWDLTRVGINQLEFTGAGLQNPDYWVWDSPVYLPTTSYLLDTFDSEPDQPPGMPAALSQAYPCGTNNCIGTHLGGQFYLYLFHLKQGSIPPTLMEDTTVAAGTLVGTVGNSGVSFAPHLHMSVYWFDATAGRSWSVPAEWRDVYHSTTPSNATLADTVDPGTGAYLSPDPF